MYLRMLKADLKDKPGLNAVTLIFMIAAVTFMVIGSTLLYSLFAGEQNTYKKCNTTDVYFLIEQSVSDKEGLRKSYGDAIRNTHAFKDIILKEKVATDFNGIEFIGDDVDEAVHYTSRVFICDVPNDVDRPIDMEDNAFFEVKDGCAAISQVTHNKLGVNVGDKVRITTQMGNTYEFYVSTLYINPASSHIDQIYLSDNDTEKIFSESPRKSDGFYCVVGDDIKDYISELQSAAGDVVVRFSDFGSSANASKVLIMNNDGLFAIIVSLSMVVIAGAVMTMAMITIDFSLKSALKREEREIGMMKAIGVWSLSYKVFFILKYLLFAVAGGVLGLPLGFFLNKLLFDKFVMNTVYPDPLILILIGVVVSLVTITLIILFSFFALRRINKVSVIDAIHGENRGERFSSLPGLALNDKKRMAVPLFLALSDILRGFKRYVLLILAYVLGICIVLFVVRLNDSILTTDYAYKFFQNGRLDFLIRIEDSYYAKLVKGAGSFDGVIEQVNKEFKDNDIPAVIYVEDESAAVMHFKNKDYACAIKWNNESASEIEYFTGDAPKLANEVAVGYYHAREKGIGIGDVLTLEYDKYSDDHTTFHKVKEDFIVTGLVDQFGNNNLTLLMGDDFEGAPVLGSNFFSCKLDVPEDQYDEYISKMQEIYPNGEIKIMKNEEVMPYFLTGYQPMFRLMILIVSVICTILLVLLTALYENIFLDEEAADIALLKSMGFSRSVISAWHFLRLLILALIAVAVTYLFMETLGNFLVGNLFTSIMKCGSFRLKVLPLSNFVIIPVVILTGLAVIMFFMAKMTNKIQIWKVRNE